MREHPNYRDILNYPPFWGLTIYFSQAFVHGFFDKYSVTRVIASLICGMFFSFVAIFIVRSTIQTFKLYKEAEEDFNHIIEQTAAKEICGFTEPSLYRVKEYLYPTADPVMRDIILGTPCEVSIGVILRKYMNLKSMSLIDMASLLIISDGQARQLIYSKSNILYTPTYRRLERAFGIPELVWRDLKT